MSDTLQALAGTPAGATLALILAVAAAALHAVFGALQKGRHDPFITRGAVDFCYGIMAAPIALFVVPWPEPHMWPIFLGMFVIHVIYKFVQGMAYLNGDFTVVYPVVRGLGPVVTVIAAGWVFQEHFTAIQWGGVMLLTLSILALSAVNLKGAKGARRKLGRGLAWAAMGGIMVAAYTTYDAYGIRAAGNPLTFLAWFFFIDGIILFPWIALFRWRAQDERPDPGPLMLRGFFGGLVAYFSFGSIMLATYLDKVGEAAVLRETSPVFAALIGWFFLGDRIGPLRAILITCIALGAILVETGAQ